MSNKDLINKILKAIKHVAKEVGKPEAEITKAEFLKHAPLEISDWELRKAGGLSSILKTYFETEVDLVAKTGAIIIKAQKEKLNKKYGTEEFLKQEFTSQMLEVIGKAQFKVHPRVKASKKSKSGKRTIVAHVSDTHFGANISGTEMGQVNKFNWTIASRRMALFAKQIADYKPQYRKETDLAIVLNGDIIAGVIHNQEWFVDLLTTQFAGTLKILLQFITYLATKFKVVKVYCTPGNHGRPMHKLNHGRSTTHKWDSYENMIFIALQNALKGSNIEVDVPLTPFVVMKLQGHQFFVTHGDTVISVGNVGASLNMRSINNQINKLNSSDIGGTAKFAAVLTGHVHVPTVQVTESGAMLIVNGCLSGTDPYAQSIGIFTNEPVQQLFEVTEDHAVGDIRFINLKGADNSTELDSIIEPFEVIM